MASSNKSASISGENHLPDTTDQKASQATAADNSIRQDDERFRLLVESIQDYAIFMLDSQGHIASWNEGAQRIKGYSASEIIGRHFSCFYPDEDIQSGKPQKELVSAAEHGHLEDEGWRLRKDGSRFWANVIITALRDRHGTLCGFSKVTRDITDKMRAVELLRESNGALKREVDERMAAERRLQESETALRTLSRYLFRTQDEERKHFGSELHDSIGQYLAALKMGLDSLDSDQDLKAPGIRRHIGESIRLADQCIKEVRTMSYVLYPPLLDEIGLRIAIPWYLDGFTRRSGITTKFDIPRDFGRLSRDLELTFFRVLQECLANVHWHSGNPEALVRLFMQSDAAVLEVEDSGNSVPMSDLEFNREEGSAAGLGFRGMEERVRQVGGKLEMFLTPEGTVVRASIPGTTTASEGSIH